MKVLLITTGGTIDGADLDTGATRPNSALQKYLEADTRFRTLVIRYCNKDSREITDEDRLQLFELISNSDIHRILIGHGTFTICQTGQWLKSRLKNEKRVLLVGAWIPFEDPDSDAATQVEFALNALTSDEAGVFVAIDGRLWDPDKTEKKEIAPGKWTMVEDA